MSPASRRIFVYGLLLLLPTLAVGFGALALVRREQARVAAATREAGEARRTAAAARARLIAENVELLVGDVQNGLLDTLATAPADELEVFLPRWQASNPFVTSTFLADPSGNLLWPRSEGSDEPTRGFIQRMARLLRPQPPWASAEPKAGLTEGVDRSRPEPPQDKAASSRYESANVAKARSARRDVQELVRSSEQAANSLLRDRSAAEERYAASQAQSQSKIAAAAAAPSRQPQTLKGFAGAVAGNSPRAEAMRGWRALTENGRVHLVGWIEPDGDRVVRGVELNFGALVSRLGGSMPAEANAGEGFVLNDADGRPVYQVGRVSLRRAPAAEVKIADALLSGWSVAAYIEDYAVARSAGVFWSLALLLIALLILAILAATVLLVRQARRSEQDALQKTSFVSNVSHELKTPLTTIRLYAELLEQGRVTDATRREEYLRTIGRETQRLARLVNNVLDFSRLEQGRKKFALETLDLTAEVRRLLDAHGMRIQNAGLRVESDLPDIPVLVDGDRDAIEQIVLNLLENACKYAAEGGAITVRIDGFDHKAGSGVPARPRSGVTRVRLVVADRGPGVPAADRERIFEKFHRVDEALTAEKSGAGLGLSIARQLARGMGGDLRYEGGEEPGARFVLELPKASNA